MAIWTLILAGGFLWNMGSFASPTPIDSLSQSQPIDRRQDVAAPTATIDAKRYFHNCNGYLDREKEAWDDANTLAQAALDWQPGGNFQPDADLYLGTDSNNSAMVDRISNNFKNAVAVHGRNWIWPEASIDVWCWENGTEGLPPVPDEAVQPWLGGCDSSTYAYSYIRKHAYWFHLGYTIVFCPRFWSTITTPSGIQKQGKFSLQNVLAWAEKYEDLASDPDLLALNRGQTYLHELMHLDGLVGNPTVDDLVYGAPNSAGLAMIYGTASKLNASSFPQLNGEWGSTRNADSYALFANSIYFREQLKQQEPPTPTGNWKETATFVVGPRETDITAAYGIMAQPPDVGGDALASMGGIIDKPMDNTEIPVYERPPAPPNCTASNAAADPSLFNNLAAGFCRRVVPGIAIVLTLNENDLVPEVPTAKIKVQFSFAPPRDGSSIGCGLSCIDTYTNLTSTCQSDSHTLTGSSEVSMGCGTWGFEINEAT